MNIIKLALNNIRINISNQYNLQYGRKYKEMKGFEYEDIGLFTFYRQQAEYQQQRQIQKRQEVEQKKIKKQQYRLKKYRQGQDKQKRTGKQYNSMPSVTIPKLNYTQKAKQYIKQIQLYGHNKLMHSYRKKQRKNFKNTQQYDKQMELQKQYANKNEPIRYQSYGEEENRNIHLNGCNSEEIFINKKEVAKSGYYRLLNKEALHLKQFNSIQIFQVNNPPETYKFIQMEQSLKKKVQEKQSKHHRQKLPKLSPDYTSARSSQSLPKKQKKKFQRNHYNPIDIIMNNERYQINQLQKSNRIHGKQQQNVIKMDMINQDSRQNSVLAMIKRFRMIK